METRRFVGLRGTAIPSRPRQARVRAEGVEGGGGRTDRPRRGTRRERLPVHLRFNAEPIDRSPSDASRVAAGPSSPRSQTGRRFTPRPDRRSATDGETPVGSKGTRDGLKPIETEAQNESRRSSVVQEKKNVSPSLGRIARIAPSAPCDSPRVSRPRRPRRRSHPRRARGCGSRRCWALRRALRALRGPLSPRSPSRGWRRRSAKDVWVRGAWPARAARRSHHPPRDIRKKSRRPDPDPTPTPLGWMDGPSLSPSTPLTTPSPHPPSRTHQLHQGLPRSSPGAAPRPRLPGRRGHPRGKGNSAPAHPPRRPSSTARGGRSSLRTSPP